MIQQHVVSYAQNREDLLLSAFFDDDEVGFYVDVGAEDPEALSVTKLFYDKGWRGINIEPIPRQYKFFIDSRPRDINLNVGVAEHSGELSFREYEGSGYSTFSDDMKQEHLKDDEGFVKKYKDYKLPVLSLQEIFAEHDVQSIQFLKIDVEGLEYQVIKSNDWNRWRPEVICIEANHVKKDWHVLLKKHEYESVFFDGLNEYYADQRTKRAAKFNYVRGIIYKEPIVHYKLLPDFQRYDEAIAWQDSRIDSLKAELQAAQDQVKALQASLEDVTPLKRHIVKHVKGRVNGVDARIVQRLRYDTAFQPTAFRSSPDDALAAVKQYDSENFAKYDRVQRESRLLPYYQRAKRTTHRAVRRAAHKIIKD